MMTVAPPLVLVMCHAAQARDPTGPQDVARRYRRSGLPERQGLVHGAAVAGGAAGAVGGVVAGVVAGGTVAAAACSASMRNASSSIALATGPASLPPVLAEI